MCSMLTLEVPAVFAFEHKFLDEQLVLASDIWQRIFLTLLCQGLRAGDLEVNPQNGKAARASSRCHASRVQIRL